MVNNTSLLVWFLVHGHGIPTLMWLKIDTDFPSQKGFFSQPFLSPIVVRISWKITISWNWKNEVAIFLITLLTKVKRFLRCSTQQIRNFIWRVQCWESILFYEGKSFINNRKFENFPDDFNRVVLEPELEVADSDYINASYVDVSTCKNARCPKINNEALNYEL